jgi:hypothetical protein
MSLWKNIYENEILIFQRRPSDVIEIGKRIYDCEKCVDNLERFWRKTIRRDFS